MTVGVQRRPSSDGWELIETLAGHQPLTKLTNLKNHISKLAQKYQDSGKYKQTCNGMSLLEDLAIQFILQAIFVTKNWSPKIGSKITLSGFMRVHHAPRIHRSLVFTLLTRLETSGILSKGTTTNSWTISKHPPSTAIIIARIKHIQTQLLAYPECAAEIELLNHTGPQLGNVLRGKITGLDVLFPLEGSPGFQFGAQNFYSNSDVMGQTKTVYVIHAVLEIARELVSMGQKEIKILEIGAGLGSTTVLVLKALMADDLNLDIHYTFTDISNFFVGKSKDKIERQFPTVKFDFRSLDIEQAPEYSDEKCYDLIIAADVFHATCYLDDTLRHTQAMLKTHGILILSEIFKSSMFLETTVGLAEGWWRFRDELRSGSPLISNSKWEAIMKQYGCVDAFSVSNGTYGVVFGAADLF